MSRPSMMLTGAAGEYELLERITQGGMAEVYRAKRRGAEGFERVVAVKRIRPELASDKLFVSMFLDEAKIAAELDHPNIVQTIDLGKSGSEYFIALEFIEGTNLRTLLDKCYDIGAAIPRGHACRIVAEVCAGLSYAHNKRRAGVPMDVVHRDVSPSNVIIGNDGQVKLIDFGVAKARARCSWTKSGTVKGKVPYLSPEQARGMPADYRSDIFAAGALLWESLTNERLFDGPSDWAILQMIRNFSPPPPSRTNPSIPPELDEIVVRALATNPEDRFADAAELQDRLLGYMRSSGEHSGSRGLATWVQRVMSSDEDAWPEPPTLMMKCKTTRSGGRPPFAFGNESVRDAAEALKDETRKDVVAPDDDNGLGNRITNRHVIRREAASGAEGQSGAADEVRVAFDSMPSGAEVVLRNSKGAETTIGKTPVDVSLPRGASYEVRMVKDEYAVWNGRLELDRPEQFVIRAELKPPAGASTSAGFSVGTPTPSNPKRCA